MGSKEFEVVNVNADELALSLVGWQIVDAQARIVTEPRGRNGCKQQVAFSGTFRFLPEDWTDRFKRSDGRSYASEVFLTLNRQGVPTHSGSYKWVVLEKIKDAENGVIRVSAQSDDWTCDAPLAATDIDLRLTAYDLDDVSDLYINSKLSLPTPVTTPLETSVVSETSLGAPCAKVAVAAAYVSKGDYKTTLTVHTEGTFEFGSVEDLLKGYRTQNDWDDHGSTVMDYAPFEVNVPQVRFEILDGTGFLLNDRTCSFYGYIPVDNLGNVPRRQPRWIGRRVFDVSDLPGDPYRVVVRVTDSIA
ncbi:hypothetical protein ACFXHA_40870 [Nocardia sp. NPDC059240]|uniref:hypothetical protein n=1 Tax=Nocardia sp. NPDC059240 TaxID=3346786 RepID=UPI0036B98EEF